ncbi:MAG: DNA polymerase Y family protein [Myxococcota bacterium]|nr:DNA polymerase Y family protein [Myxococcota bacterium]
MQRRIACIALPDIRVEVLKERESGESPLAVIVARPGGVVKTEREVLGNTRIDFVSRDALVLGIGAGQTVATARAKCADLRVRVLAEGTVRTALARIAEASLAFGPTTAFDVAQDVIWVDVSGCAHLHGGEVELARMLGAHVRALGHACRVAVADGPRLAAVVSRYATASDPMVVPEGKGAAAVRSLPIAALALDADVSTWLADLGLSTCGDLQKLPRRALGMRLGERVHDVMQLLDGRDHAPLDAWRPPDVPEERVELDWGAHSIDALAFVLRTLCDRLAARIQGRALAVARLEIVLALDRAMLCEDASSSSAVEPSVVGHRVSLSITLPSPIARAADLLAIVRARLEGCSLAAPVLAVTLRATELVRAPARTLDLLAPEPKADSALPRLVAELLAELGEGTVGMLTLVDTWFPSERTRLVPYLTESARSRHSLVTSALEPSRFVPATHVPHGTLARAHHLARVESVQWWQHMSASSGCRCRDLFAAWVMPTSFPNERMNLVPTGGALGWVELRDSMGEPLLCGWMD